MAKTLTPPPLPLPSLPSELVEEILARLPVKLLIQLCCVCKSWNSLICHDYKFARKHLCLSPRRPLLNTFSYSETTKYNLNSYPIHSTFTNTVASNFSQFQYPPNHINGEFPTICLVSVVGSCDGILCLACINSDFDSLVLLWNPSIRKFKELPKLPRRQYYNDAFGFGYDSLSDTYKVVAVNNSHESDPSSGKLIMKAEAKVHTLGTNFWRNIKEFPSVPSGTGQFVCGKLNWLPNKDDVRLPGVIISLNLENESYQEVLQPDYRGVVNVRDLILGRLKDCLCILNCFDVWVMKEYGNKDSWAKMFTLPNYVEDPGEENNPLLKAIYIFEDGYLLLDSFNELVLYDSRNSIVKFPSMERHSIVKFPSMEMHMSLEVSVESLISPCSSC